VDFFSIGTNDLTQYTLAVDRQNEAITEFCDPRHEAVLRLIRTTVENAHKAGIEAGICGSLAADSRLTKTFVDIGVDELSVVPSAILRLRQSIAGLD
jgi:phosphotransferase system enzyme I (PtsI)